MLEETTNNLLVKLDELEEQINYAELVIDEYNNLKKDLKKSMVEYGKTNNLDQLKWTTPKGTKITCSIGHPAEFEKQIVKEFDILILKEKYPQIYDECMVEKETNVMVKNASNDTLRITLSKGDK